MGMCRTGVDSLKATTVIGILCEADLQLIQTLICTL